LLAKIAAICAAPATPAAITCAAVFVLDIALPAIADPTAALPDNIWPAARPCMPGINAFAIPIPIVALPAAIALLYSACCCLPLSKIDPIDAAVDIAT
jgi:hypothetical protein